MYGSCLEYTEQTEQNKTALMSIWREMENSRVLEQHQNFTTQVSWPVLYKWAGTHRYAVAPHLVFTLWRPRTFYSVPGPLTSSQYPFLSPPYQSVSWRFITLGCDMWLSPLSSFRDYMTLTFLFLRKWNVSWKLHPCANTKVLCVSSGTAVLRICLVLCCLSAPTSCI